jgi:hypothetical protein
METIRIFAGSDSWQRDAGAERVLEHSIRSRTQRSVDIVWMRAGDPGWEVSRDGAGGSWRVGAAVDNGWVKAPGMNWGTPFSGFRFAIPELCGFQGRAIYLDVDMLVLADIAELWEQTPAQGFGIKCINARRTDVSVIDCAWFAGKPWWPSIAKMKPSGARVFEYITLLNAHKAVDATLAKEWNDIDGAIYQHRPQDVKLEHYSAVPTQPYRPYPKTDYRCTEFPHHPCEAVGKLWWNEHDEATSRTGS